MPAPPSDLVEALRGGPTVTKVARHVFFKMTHSQGDVLAWDGVGDFELDSEVYKGVAGFAAIEGVSDSGDIQNHDVAVSINGVSMSDLLSVDTNVRGEAVTIKAAWIKEDGTVLRSRTVLIGKGDVLKVKPAERAVTVKVRGPLADWTASPRAYYTDADQQRRFPPVDGEPVDTGFKLVKFLENATIAGWSKDEESSGATVNWAGSSGGLKYGAAFDSVDHAIIGAETLGAVLRRASGDRLVTGHLGENHAFTEDESGAAVTVNDTDGMRCGGVPVYVDILGVVRTAGGKLIRIYSSARYLRKQTEITEDGAAGTTQITRSTRFSGVDGQVPDKLAISAFNQATDDWSDAVYDNYYGAESVDVEDDGSVTGEVGGVEAPYVEASTGNAVTYSSDRLRVGGSPCVLSANGVVLSPNGNRIVLQGGHANSFLRIWT